MSSKKINNIIVDYVYGTHGQLLAELTNGRVTKEYIYLYDELIALGQNNEIYYVFTDYLGRPEILTDVHSDIVWKASHLAFLRTVSVDKINQLNIGLPGQYWDAEKQAWSSSFGDHNPLMSHNPKAMVETYAYGLSHALPLGQGESAVSNLVHYIIGNGTKKNWNFNNIDMSDVTIRDFEVVQIMIANSPPGKFIITAEKGLKLSGNDWLALGNITLKLAGELEIKSNGFWTFEGGLFAKPDPYDFNPATHRSLLGEACTLAGSTLPGKKYDVIFTVMIIGLCIFVSPMVFLLMYRVSCELPSFGDDVTKAEAIEIAYREASKMETQGVALFDKSAIPESVVWLSNDHYQISYHDHQRQNSLTVIVFPNGCVEKSFNTLDL